MSLTNLFIIILVFCFKKSYYAEYINALEKLKWISETVPIWDSIKAGKKYFFVLHQIQNICTQDHYDEMKVWFALEKSLLNKEGLKIAD